MLDDRLVDGEVQSLDVGQLLLGHPGELVAMLENGEVAAARCLLRTERVDDAVACLVGPVGARLDHAAGGQRADGDVRAEHQQLVVAARRGELDVGELARLDAAGEHAGPQYKCKTPPRHRTPFPESAPPPSPTQYFAFFMPQGQAKE